MKYEKTAAFEADLARLSIDERALFSGVVRDAFIPACERRVADPSAAWPAGLRVRRVANAPGIWELTWNFAGPDGRATFEWIRIGGRPAVRWRRIGGHAIFGEPYGRGGLVAGPCGGDYCGAQGTAAGGRESSPTEPKPLHRAADQPHHQQDGQ